MAVENIEEEKPTSNDVQEMKDHLDKDAEELGNHIRLECNDYIKTETQSYSGSISNGGKLKIKFGKKASNFVAGEVVTMVQESSTHTIDDIYFNTHSIIAEHEENSWLVEMDKNQRR